MSRKNSLVSRLNSCRKIRGSGVQVVDINGTNRDNCRVEHIKRYMGKEKDRREADVNIYSLKKFKRRYCRNCEECFEYFA